MIYQFTYDEITNCSDCPFFYDYIYCEINLEKKNGYTWKCEGQNYRPDDCPLIELEVMQDDLV